MALVRIVINHSRRASTRGIRMSASNMQEKAAEAMEKLKAGELLEKCLMF